MQRNHRAIRPPIKNRPEGMRAVTKFFLPAYCRPHQARTDLGPKVLCYFPQPERSFLPEWFSVNIAQREKEVKPQFQQFSNSKFQLMAS
jgi:hypothetical protein